MGARMLRSHIQQHGLADVRRFPPHVLNVWPKIVPDWKRRRAVWRRAHFGLRRMRIKLRVRHVFLFQHVRIFGPIDLLHGLIVSREPAAGSPSGTWGGAGLVTVARAAVVALPTPG